MKMKQIAILSVLALGALIKPAFALNEGACLQDEQKFCKGKPADEVKACMKANVEKLSNACKANILDMMMKEKQKKS